MHGLGRPPQKPLEEVYRRPYQGPVATHGGRDVSHVRTACFPITVVVMAVCNHGPWRALPAPLVATFDAPLGTKSSDV
jgi:hypothetical protein